MAPSTCKHPPFTCSDICSGKFVVAAPAKKPLPDMSKSKSPLAWDDAVFEEANTKGVPKFIHQTWKDENVPAEYTEYIRSWLKIHPDWTYFLWTDRDNLALLESHYPAYVPVYNGYRNWARRVQKADFIRYFILHKYGGVYVDLDFEALRPLDALLSHKGDCVIGAEPSEHAVVLYKKDVSLERMRSWLTSSL